jgi:hypothetical protein
MRVTRFIAGLLMALAFAFSTVAGILENVKTIQVDPTVIPNPDKVKDAAAADHVQESLRGALRRADFEIGESPVRAHIVLDEVTSGNFAQRFVIGFGAGRSTVAGHVVFVDGAGKEIANVRIRVRGSLAWGAYQGGKTQGREASNSFEQRLFEEIKKLK